MPQVTILGGSGRIGCSIAQDLRQFCPQARIILTGRRPTAPPKPLPGTYATLDLNNYAALGTQIAASDLVVHCAGPFHHRDGRVLEICLDCGVDYLDVSDHRSFYQRAIAHHDRAVAAGVTAIVNTGIFPGISNSLVRLACERLDRPETIQLSYAVGGTGGAGLTVMRTTFLGLQHPFEVWQDERWQLVRPYSDREVVAFPAPVGRVGVYWFDVPEAYTFTQTWPTVRSVTTKFGSYPDIYNRLTAAVAQLPRALLAHPQAIELLSRLGYGSAKLTDRFSGTGVAIAAVVTGLKGAASRQISATLVHPNTAIAAGCGAGSIAAAILTGNLHQPGVYPVEAALPTELFVDSLNARDMSIEVCES
ncbi:MAG: saccharopine dehydrogenase NADP-binding domain-containing protein [Cyanobacteria bacterium J06641_5]